ncbi:MAG: class I SAM-dependent methyltransferase, partial [Vicinamibacterales bacterium]
PSRVSPSHVSEGWHGWDDYAAYYDWENARTLGRRDVSFWRGVLTREAAPTLELGCGTGRLLIPMARAGVRIAGIDRSTPMLARAVERSKRLPVRVRPQLFRGDIRSLPFAPQSFGAVMAPYGLLQSLIRPADLESLLGEVARVLTPGGLLGIDLVPDLPKWQEYHQQISLRGRSRTGAQITLIESVRQDRRRGLTMFDEEFVERSRSGVEQRRTFTLTFRTLAMTAVTEALERHGFRVDVRCGSYAGAAWAPDADVWIVMARKRASGVQS